MTVARTEQHGNVLTLDLGGVEIITGKYSRRKYERISGGFSTLVSVELQANRIGGPSTIASRSQSGCCETHVIPEKTGTRGQSDILHPDSVFPGGNVESRI